ncbi:RNA polymerase subunit sigma-70 [Plantactinospora siamensis]|uniref:RNA polymerase subunit sigma-70 n=1 Tax=Plantactinospora siamensis TaxID=555372 RepID=A0ABV6P2Q9_9ACTN
MSSTATEPADPDQFARRVEPYRRELLAHCYRLLGAAQDAEDLVQETYLRAWRSYDRFEGRSSVRVWLYRIATNACLTALARHGRRALPSDLSGPADDPDTPPSPAPGVDWLQPIADARFGADPRHGADSADPAAIVVGRESLRLALVASLQHLPPRQRAVFMLREVLAFSADEVAEMLGTTTPAVKSMLQRARARLDQVAPGRGRVEEPTEPRARALLEAYVAGFENADTAALERALRSDAAIELVGTRTWFAGRSTCLRFLERVIGSAGTWRMVPVAANGGQLAGAAYRRGGDGGYHAFGLGLLSITGAGIGRIVVFDGGPGLLAEFGLPATAPDHPPRTL